MGRAAIGLVVFADTAFQHRFEGQIASLHCFARRHGYEMWVMEGYEFPPCMDPDPFFRKHCIVASFLELQVDGYQAVVLDADVVGFVLPRGLEQWTQLDYDIQLYERGMTKEIAAGNYLVRNTPFARKFLRGWVNFTARRPPGFSSADNGALHLHIVEVLG